MENRWEIARAGERGGRRGTTEGLGAAFRRDKQILNPSPGGGCAALEFFYNSSLCPRNVGDSCDRRAILQKGHGLKKPTSLSFRFLDTSWAKQDKTKRKAWVLFAVLRVRFSWVELIRLISTGSGHSSGRSGDRVLQQASLSSCAWWSWGSEHRPGEPCRAQGPFWSLLVLCLLYAAWGSRGQGSRWPRTCPGDPGPRVSSEGIASEGSH